jgi:deoxyuridine 5'-triphosphate nucleotidohydrolase
MHDIDSEHKAYLLGFIASDGHIQKDEIQIKIHERDLDILRELRDFVCKDLPIREGRDNMVTLTINSTQISKDVCVHLGINFGKKDTTVRFPELKYEQLQWDFLRGYFDGDGCVSTKKSGYPQCSISSNSETMLESIRDFCTIPCSIYRNQIVWEGINAVDLLAQLYCDASMFIPRKYTMFLSIANWQSTTVDMRRNPIPKRLPIFRWSRTISGAPAPQKTRFSDSGYDLHLVKKVKVRAKVHYYDTGIQVQPEVGYYFDLVGRSSISKSGWMLANNVGIIDSSYTGSIQVALVRTDADAEEPELPCRLVQIIPRQLILMEGEEVWSLNETQRGDGGFGSTGHCTK